MTFTDQRTEGTNALRGLIALIGLLLVTIGLVQTFHADGTTFVPAGFVAAGGLVLTAVWKGGPR